MSSRVERPAGGLDLSRVAGYLFVVAAVLTGIIFVFWMNGTDPKTNPKRFADSATGATALAAGYVYIIALAALMLGLVALYAVLANVDVNPPALAGLVLSEISIGILVAVQGGSTLGGAVVARAYLGGNADAAVVMEKFNGGTFGQAFMTAFTIAAVLAALGAILLGIATWRSSVLPRAAAVLLGVGLFLMIVIMRFVSQVGEVLFAIAGLLIARSGGARTSVSRSEMAQAT